MVYTAQAGFKGLQADLQDILDRGRFSLILLVYAQNGANGHPTVNIRAAIQGVKDHTVFPAAFDDDLIINLFGNLDRQAPQSCYVR